MKKLIALISPQGKTSKQLTDEVWEAFQKFQKVYKESLKQVQEQSNKKSTKVLSPQVKSKQPELTLDQRIQQENEQLKREGRLIQEPVIPEGSMQVMFFNTVPKYPKNPVNSSNETFDTLWKYCTSNNRLCPIPMKWNELFGMLKNKRQIDGESKPSLPLILSGWEHTVPVQKYLVFKEHIRWASDNNQIEEIGKYLRSLSESDWAHYGEI